MKGKVLAWIAGILAGAGIAVGVLALTGRLADTTTTTTTRPPLTTEEQRWSPGSPNTTHPSPSHTSGFTPTTVDAALVSLCIDLRDRFEAAVADYTNGWYESDKEEAVMVRSEIQRNCPYRYLEGLVIPLSPYGRSVDR